MRTVSSAWLAIAALILLCAGALAWGQRPPTPPAPSQSAPVSTEPAPNPSPAQTSPARPGGQAPDFTLKVISPPNKFTLSEYDSRPILLFFFDAGDMPSANAVPYVAEWHRRYANDSLVVMGMHEPEYPPMADEYMVIEALARENALFPVAMDSSRSVYEAYGIQDLPAYVILKPGRRIAAETWSPRPYAAVETEIQKVLTEIKPGMINPFLVKPLRPVDDPAKKVFAATPQIMLGCGFDTISGFNDSECDSFCNYKDLGEKIRELVYLQGYWKVTPNSVVHTTKMGSSGDRLRVIYSGTEVWLLPSFVYGSAVRVYVMQDRAYADKSIWGRDILSDDLGNPYILMKYSVPIQVIKNRSFGTHELELMPAEGDVALYYIFFEDGVAQ